MSYPKTIEELDTTNYPKDFHKMSKGDQKAYMERVLSSYRYTEEEFTQLPPEKDTFAYTEMEKAKAKEGKALTAEGFIVTDKGLYEKSHGETSNSSS